MEAVWQVGKNSGSLLSRCIGARLWRSQTGATPFLLSQQRRLYAEGGNYMQVERDNVHGEIAILKMSRKPVNGMNRDFMNELDDTLKMLENNNSYRGVILTSANPNVFSAGLDIQEMYQKSPDYLGASWRSLQDSWMTLYGTKLATVAAINGHAPAGGCLMALSCDYRIMADGKYTIGFSAINLGLQVPFWVQELMSRVCGQRTAEMSFQRGLLYKPDEALTIGLVDKVVPLDELMNAARKQMMKWLQVPDHARIITKGMLRAPLLEKVRSKQEEIAYFTNFIGSDTVQKSIKTFLEKLKKKNK